MRAMILIILLLFGVQVFASPQTVKVGFYANSDNHEFSQNDVNFGYDLLRQMSRYANLNYEYVGYDKTWKDLLKMLENGEIDLVSSSRDSDGQKGLFVFSLPVGPNLEHIIVRKSDKALLNEINYAIREMDRVTPNWRIQLYSKYYDNSSMFSERESAFLKDLNSKNRTLKVTVQNAKAPYAYMDNGVAKGILLEIFAEIAKRSGLNYEFVLPEKSDEDNSVKFKKLHIVLDAKYGMAGGDSWWIFTPEYMQDQVFDRNDSLLLGLRIAVPKDVPRELVSILTKGVLTLSSKFIRQKVTKYAGFRMPNYVGELLHEQSQLAMILGVIFGGVGLVLICSLVWLAFRRKLKNRQEKFDFKLREAEAFAAEAKEAKSKFLLNMSHDIRTPMNAIIGYAERAERHIERQTEVQDALKKIRIAGGYLLQLIEEVLDMAKIESGQLLNKERMVNLTSCMAELCKGFTPIMKHKNISFICEFSSIKNKFVMANVYGLRRILFNVISNAQKFTPYGGRVIFNIEELPSQADGYAVFDFEISDNGLGMSKEFLEHIYDEFAREQSSTQSGIHGTGLGMSIVKRLADMMGAEINIQSEIGFGTNIHIRTQFKIATAEDVALDPSVKNAPVVGDFLKGKRVLLVEDNEFNREIAQDFLNDAQMVVDVAENGLEAVTKVRENRPDFYDCVLMDVQMPVMDGYEATRAIRKLYPNKHIPIIALSANAFEEDRLKSIAAGMDAHLSKPIVVSKVLETMNVSIRRNVNVS